MDSPESPAALAGRYDAVAYAATPHPLTHPDHIAAVATLFGYTPAMPAASRVLEVGCNDGANLVPMAATLPNAQFVGCDLSARAIGAGRAMVEGLGLGNVTLLRQDLATLDASLGPFDYVIAHGVYSWVPAGVREALFALAAARLAPGGLMFVSYNTLPGCRVRQAAWEMLHHHVDGIADPAARMAAARAFARMMADGAKSQHPADEAVRAELRAIAERNASQLFHDDLAIPNDPVYFRDIAAHAARHGLAYLAEAEVNSMSGAGVSGETRQFLSTLDPLAREQYLDFARLRRFRQSIFRRAREAARAPAFSPQCVTALHVAVDASLQQAAEEGKLYELARQLDPRAPDMVRAWLADLVERAPATVPVADARQRLVAHGVHRDADALLREAYVSALVTLHAEPPRLTTTPSARPLASPVARWQASRQDALTTLRHGSVRLADPHLRHLVGLLDGTRDRTQLVAAMGPRWPVSGAAAAARLDAALAQLGRLGLLAA